MKPITRLEKFLAKIAKDPNATEIAPKTRKEYFLNEIAENSSGSSGGGAEPFVVTFSGGGDYGDAACDKTYFEIVEAYNAGKEIKTVWKNGNDRVECLTHLVTQTPTQFNPYPIGWLYAYAIVFDMGYKIKFCQMNMSRTSVDDIPVGS